MSLTTGKKQKSDRKCKRILELCPLLVPVLSETCLPHHFLQL